MTDDGGKQPTDRRWAPGALIRADPLDSDARSVVSVAAYRLRNRLQRDAGHLRRLLDGADLSDPAVRRRARLRVAAMVQALLDAEGEFR